MKKISKLILVIAALALVVSAFAVVASAEEATAFISTDAYFGEYESGDLSGAANIIFGQVNADATEYGIVVKDAGGNKKVFKGLAKGAEGKFGVALYTMPDGLYYVNVYSGAPTVEEGGVLSDTMAIYANQGKQVVVSIDWNYSRAGSSYLYTYEGGTVTAPDVETLEKKPANANFEGYFIDGAEFDWTQPITENVKVEAKWVSNGALDDKIITYKSVASVSNSTSIGSSAGVDLSDGGSITMTFDVVTGHTHANFQTKTSALAWLPVAGASGYNNGWSSTGHLGLAGNPAYTEAAAQHYGYASASYPGGAVKAFDFGETPADPDLVMTAGSTFKAVYTAPTAETAGSIIWYTKSSLADDSAYVESASMRNISIADVFSTTDTYFWLDFYNCSTGGGISMTFRNFKVVHDGVELPVEFFNHYDEEITMTDAYAADTSKVYEIGVDAVTSGPQVGWLMSKDASSTLSGGVLTLEMDVLESNLASHNINIGVSLFNSTGVGNDYASGFYDSQWIGNPMFTGEEDGKSSWKTEDVSNKTAPECDPLYVEEIWAAGNSVRIVYTMPTATSTGSIEIFVKYIDEGEDAWYNAATAYDITQDQVVNTGNKIMLGMIFQATQSSDSACLLKVTNLRSYNAIGDIELIAQRNLIFREVVEA